MMKRKIVLIIGLMFAFSSVGNASIQSVKPDIKKISFWNGTWQISYDEMKNGINLLKEELFVDGKSDRVVTIGTEEKRGFPLHGSYSKDACHKATIVMYDRANNVVSRSDEFEFGDTSKCTPQSSELKILAMIDYGNNTWHIDYKDVAVSTAYSVEKLYVDGVEDRTVNAGTTDARLRRGFSVHGAYASDECHTAYLELYDNNGVKVKTSESFEFGDTSKCTNVVTCDLTTAISLEALKEKIANAEDVTQVNTCAITDMSYLFTNNMTFNQNIGSWDTRNVINMEGMFYGADNFNQPIGEWDVSKVTNMSKIFSGAVYFNKPIHDWNVSNVTNMSSMFAGMMNFTQSLKGWDVSKVTDMSSMFSGSEFLSPDIKEWDVSSVTDMSKMFNYVTTFNEPIGDWNVSNVTNMNEMFFEAYHFNQDIGAWDVSNVTNMASMFVRAFLFDVNIKNWDVSKVTNHSSFADGSGLHDIHNPFVHSQNQPPIVNAGDDYTIYMMNNGSSGIKLNGVATDSDGVITSYEWREGAMVLAITASFTYSSTILGEHNLTLVVMDDDGLIGSDEVTIRFKSFRTDYYLRNDTKEMVSDYSTGLQWQDNEETETVTKKWARGVTYADDTKPENFNNSEINNDTSGDTATTYCSELTLGGHNDWRLPSKDELLGIIDEERTNPSINPMFVHTQSHGYWSSNSTTSNSRYAWMVYFGTGGAYDYEKYYTYHVRCVRTLN